MTTWTKQSLADTINQKVDRGELSGDYIMAGEISDAALKHFQNFWDGSTMNPAARVSELKKLYHSIIAGW